jgi:hypothetical protein
MEKKMRSHHFIFDDKDGAETVEIWDRNRSRQGDGGSGGVQFMNKAQLVDQVLKNKKAGFESKAAAERAFDAVVDATARGASQFNGPPHILFAIPSSGGSFMPIVITGSRFENPTIPYINGVPSMSLFNFGINNIPLIGSFTIGSTIVPGAAPRVTSSHRFDYYGQRSNLYPFTVH